MHEREGIIHIKSHLKVSHEELFILSTQAILDEQRIEIDAKLHLATSRTRRKGCYPFYTLFSQLHLYFSHDSIPITSTKSEIILLAAPRSRIHIQRDFRDCWKLRLLVHVYMCTNQNQYLILNIKKHFLPIIRFHVKSSDIAILLAAL